VTRLFSNPDRAGGNEDFSAADPLFASVLIPRHLAGWSLLASVALHAAGLAVVPPALAALFGSSESVLAVEVARVQPLRLQVPETLYYARPEPPAPPPRRAEPPAKPKGDRTQARPAGGETPALRKFRAPDVPPVPDAVQTLLQPQDPPNLRPPEDLRLPEFFLWAVADTPPPPLKKFVPPAPVRPSSATPVLAAPPRLDLPNYELPVADLKIGFAPVPDYPELPVEVSSVVPLQDEAAAGLDAMDVQMGLDEGEPYLVAALALSPNPAPWNDEIEVLPGNQVAPSGGGSAASTAEVLPVTASLGESAGAGEDGEGGVGGAVAPGTEGAGDSAEGSAAGDSPGEEGAASAGAENGSGEAGESAVGGEAATGSEWEPLSASASAGSPEGVVRAEAGAAGAAATPSLAARRIVYPPDGKFDVVVIQATPEEALGLEAGVLSGNPIYTVYLPVADVAEWVMQYCIPAEPVDSEDRGTRIVRLGSPAPLIAPYPKLAIVPPARFFPAHRRLPIHGFLSAEGRLEELRILGDAENSNEVLEALQQWEFRPATRDAVPVRIEVLVIIPPGGGLSAPQP